MIALLSTVLLISSIGASPAAQRDEIARAAFDEHMAAMPPGITERKLEGKSLPLFDGNPTVYEIQDEEEELAIEKREIQDEIQDEIMDELLDSKEVPILNQPEIHPIRPTMIQ